MKVIKSADEFKKNENEGDLEGVVVMVNDLKCTFRGKVER